MVIKDDAVILSNKFGNREVTVSALQNFEQSGDVSVRGKFSGFNALCDKIKELSAGDALNGDLPAHKFDDIRVADKESEFDGPDIVYVTPDTDKVFHK